MANFFNVGDLILNTFAWKLALFNFVIYRILTTHVQSLKIQLHLKNV